MSKARRKRVERRRVAASKLTGHAALQLHSRLIEGWSQAYARRLRISFDEAERFRLQKANELQELGADYNALRLLEAAFMSQRFAIEERRLNAGALTVPTHLVGNYEAIETFTLKELRQR